MENKVTVWCTVFNHEKFLRRCLDGFVMQKTKFPFEIIVHDDCSSDRSREIIHDYATRYPQIIHPVFEEKNQYSQGLVTFKKIQMKYVRSKYFALCEGDDYWTDPDKLQRQYDYMENHPKCSMCLHNTLIHDLTGKKEDKKFFSWNEIHTLTEKEIFFGWHVHTSSYFIRSDLYKDFPKIFWQYWFGDYAILTYLFSRGEITALPQVMSVYDFANPEGVTMKNSEQFEVGRKAALQRADYLQDFDQYTKGKYHKIVQERIQEINLIDKISVYRHYKKSNSNDKTQILRKEIVNNAYYRTWKKEHNIKGRIGAFLRYQATHGESIVKVYEHLKKLLGR